MTSPKIVNLTIGERLAAIKIFDQFKGSLAILAILLEDVKKLTISEEEWATAELKKVPLQDGSEQWKWNEVVNKDIELQKESVDHLLAKIKEKSDAGEATLADVPLISLEAKLK